MKKTKILLIEDDSHILSIVKDVLKEEGFSVKTATDGMKGLEAANTWIPDLIICDIMMPKLDGYEVFEEIQNNPVTAKIPFIFLTAKADYTDFRKGMNMGAADYIFKPFNVKDLVRAIKIRLTRIAVLKEGQQTPDTEE